MNQKEANKQHMISTVEATLPDFVKAVKSEDAEEILLHQDAFAADYQTTEFVLLGMAIKYAGIYKKEIRIHGENEATLK